MWLVNVVFTVVSSLAGGAAYSDVLFVGANPTYTNANNLVLTSDSSTGINIAKQFVGQVGLTSPLHCQSKLALLPSMGRNLQLQWLICL